MKKLLLLLFIGITINLYSQTEQFFTTKFKKNGFVTFSTTSVINNTFKINVKVKWVNDNMSEIKNDPSVLVFIKDSFEYEHASDVQLLGFKQKNYITFHDSISLTFGVSEKFIGGKFLFDIPLYYAENQYLESLSGNIHPFQFRSPKNVSFNYAINQSDIKDNTPPKLAVISPLEDGDKPIINSDKIVVVVEANDLLGISNVKVNNILATSVGNNQYSAEVTLKTGNNLLVLRATDQSGNTTREELIVESTYYQPIEIEDGDYYALIIGINDYDDENIDDLSNAINDAEELYNSLMKNYTFDQENITFLKNPTRAEIIVTLDEISQYVSEGDNLLIFYAGHGFYDEQKKLGYWLPADAMKTNTANWIRNSTIRDYIFGIKSKHTLLIADACFSGSIFASRALDGPPKAINRLYDLPSRKAITSGSLTTVPDESVFIKYFVKRLEGNEEKYLTSERLFSSFKEAIINNSSTMPRYGTIQGAGDEGGDFIFIRR